MGGYNLAPAEQLFTYSGEQVYCQPSGSYALLKGLEEVVTERATYFVVSDVVATKECCPGQILGSTTCSSNFMWVEEGDFFCDIYKTISSCPGAGAWITDPDDTSRTTIMRAVGCDTSNNGCVFETQKVECTSSNQCPPAKPVCKNYVCQTSGIDPWVPTCGNRVCETGENDPNSNNYCPQDCLATPECGDGTCDQGESPANCPSDCAGFDLNLLWIVVFGILFGTIGYYKSDVIGAVILGIIGALVGYVIYWFLSLPLLGQILLGIGIGAGFVGLVYVGIIAIPIIIAAIIALK